MTAFNGGSSQFVAGVLCLSEAREMVPIFMIASETRRNDGRNNEFRRYLVNEYGSSNPTWLTAEIDHRNRGNGFGAALGFRARFGRKTREDSSAASKAGQ